MIEHKSNKRRSPSAMDRPNVKRSVLVCVQSSRRFHTDTHTHTHTHNKKKKRAGLHKTINDSMCEN